MEELTGRPGPAIQPFELIKSLIPDGHPKKAEVLQICKAQNIRFEGGDGSTPEDAILMLGVQKSPLGMMLELAYLGKIGRMPWKNKKTYRLEGRWIEAFEAQDGSWTYFDITEWFGKL